MAVRAERRDEKEAMNWLYRHRKQNESGRLWDRFMGGQTAD
jgi:hypothetical protein